MQKIDFVKNIETIVEKLKSVEIVKEFTYGFSRPGENVNYSVLNPLLFASKSNYDQIKKDSRYGEILSAVGAEDIYKETNLATLTTILKATQAAQIVVREQAVALFNFHNTLVQTLKLSKEILQSQSVTDDLVNEVENGVVIFQILIEGEGLETKQYIKIFSVINELIEAINKVINEDQPESEIILLDSGSDTNVGVKSGVETAKSLFMIFKEIWDFITNFRFYKQKQKNQSLLESLSIREEIMKKVEAGILTKEEGMQYLHIIKTRTDDLIGMKVLPKKIIMESNNVENKKLLSDIEGIKLLTSGDTSTLEP